MNPNISRKRREKARHAQGQHEHSGSEQGSNGGRGGPQAINVGEVERQLSMIGGTVLVVCGLLRGSFSGLSLAALGGALIWRGHTGHCETYQMLGYNSAEQHDDGNIQKSGHSEQPGQEKSHAAT